MSRIHHTLILLILALFAVYALLSLFSTILASQKIVLISLLFIVAVGMGITIRLIRHQKRNDEKVEDIETELELAENRLHQMWDQTQKSEFVSLASHQLRSPITAIKGYASMVLEGSFGRVPLGVQEAVGRILKASSALANTVEDFLNVSRIEEGKLEYSMSKLDFCKLIQTVIDEQMFIVKEKNLELIFNKSDAGCTIIGDAGKLKQVVNNLIDNAIKYTQSGKITVAFKRNNDAKTVRISIADTGIGMSLKTIKQLFTKYNRAHNASEINVMGTGLGLYVARLLTEAHGGRIWATSEGEKQGSTFYIDLPVDASESLSLKTV